MLCISGTHIPGEIEEGGGGAHWGKATCTTCECELVCCRLCSYYFAPEQTKLNGRRAGTYFYNQHMKTTHKEEINPVKKQKLDDDLCNGGVSVNNNYQMEEVDFGDQDNGKYSDDGEVLVGDESDEDESDEDDIEGWGNTDDAFGEDDQDDVADWGNTHHSNESSSMYCQPNNNTTATRLEYAYQDFAFLRKMDDNTNKYEVHQNQLYFFEKYKERFREKNDGTGGWRSLVYRASEGRKDDTTMIADPETAKLFHQLNTVLINASHGEQTQDVLDLVDNLVETMQRKVDEIMDGPSVSVRPSKLPRDYAAARRILIDGTHSVMRNFPAPKIIQIGDHAVVESLKELIQIHAGHHGGFEFMHEATKTGTSRSENGLNGTKAASILEERVREVLKEKAAETSIGFITFWSDSFLKSFIKQKDNSVWLFCVTISPPPGDISKGTFTQVLAMGKSGQDHTEVINHFYKQLDELEEGFKCYFAHDNTIRDVAFSLLYHSADRPERHSILNILSEGLFGKVINYSVSISTEKLPACTECYKHLVDRLNNNKDIPKRKCTKCFCWDIDPEDKAQRITPVKDDYPKEPKKIDAGGFLAKEVLPPIGRVPGYGDIGPVRLSSEWLTQACTFAYEAKRIGIWNKTQFNEYLRSCSISQARRDIIYDFAMNDRAQNKHTKPDDDEGYIPGIWRHGDCFDNCLFPDMPMHALAHGIGGDVIEFFHGILTGFKRGNGFGNFVNATISDVASFGLDWCKPKTYPKSAWVGENIMSFLRLFSYLYGMYLLNHPLNSESGSLQELMKRMINAFQSMLSHLMSLETENTSIVRDRVKLFLSTSHFCDKEYVPPKEVVDKGKSSFGVVDQLTGDQVMSLLHALHVTVPNINGDPRATLKGVTKKELISVLESKDLPTNGKKSELQLRLFNSFLDDKISLRSLDKNGSTDTVTADVSADVQKRNWVWDKGAWLSFATNIEWQINMLGPLRLIW